MKSERKRLIEACDKLWSKRVKERDRFCQMCGTNRGVLEAHHICGRGSCGTRFDLRNGVTLCKYICHVWAENHPKDFEIWVRPWVRSDVYDELSMLSRKERLFTLDELREIKTKLKQGR